jgi:hypothetical protein
VVLQLRGFGGLVLECFGFLVFGPLPPKILPYSTSELELLQTYLVNRSPSPFQSAVTLSRHEKAAAIRN